MTAVILLAEFDWDSVFAGALRGALIGGCIGLAVGLVFWLARGKGGGKS